MRTLDAKEVILPLADLIRRTLSAVEAAACGLLEKALVRETAPLCRWAIGEVLENNRIARDTGALACQDSGQAVLFAAIGREVFVCGDLTEALQKGVREGYAHARKSVCDPLTGVNTESNTPAVIYYDLVPGDRLTVAFLSKGAGSENMSRLFMLTPSQGETGIVDCVAEAVRDAGANPCPPVVLGVGIGGTAEYAGILSKRALLRETGAPSLDPRARGLEQKILTAVNALKIGAQGFGGDVTALSAAVETAPTHIGMLPVAVNIQCHSVRHGKIEI